MRLGSLFGVPVILDPSYLYSPAFVFVAMFGFSTAKVLALGPAGMVVFTVIYPLVTSACLLAHEFSHVRTGQALGSPAVDVHLYVFGAVARIREMPATPWKNFLFAAAGPFMSLALAVAFFSASYAIFDDAAYAAQSDAIRALGPGASALSFFGTVNVMLGLFNLAPAYPMDGGRILHSALWAVMKDQKRAERLCFLPSMALGAAYLAWSLWHFQLFGALMAFVLTSYAYSQYQRTAPAT